MASCTSLLLLSPLLPLRSSSSCARGTSGGGGAEGSGAYGDQLPDSEDDEEEEEGDDDGVEEEEKDASALRQRRSRHVSLLVTPDHDMYVQMGDLDRRGRDFRAEQQRRSFKKGRPMPPALYVAPAKRRASKLLNAPHERAGVRLLACASSGHTPAPEEAAQAMMAVREALRLTTDARFDAFLEVFGFWLGDGRMMYQRDGRSGAVRFKQVKDTDIAFLDDILPKLGLRVQRSGGPKVVGASVQRYITTLQRRDGTKKKVVTWDVDDQRWFDFFDAEFGVQYSRSRYYDPQAVAARQGNGPRVDASWSATPRSSTQSPAPSTPTSLPRRFSASATATTTASTPSSRSRAFSSASASTETDVEWGSLAVEAFTPASSSRSPFAASTPPAETRSLPSLSSASGISTRTRSESPPCLPPELRRLSTGSAACDTAVLALDFHQAMQSEAIQCRSCQADCFDTYCDFCLPSYDQQTSSSTEGSQPLSGDERVEPPVKEEPSMKDEPPIKEEPPTEKPPTGAREPPIDNPDEPLDPDYPIKSVKWLPRWVVMHLSREQGRLLIYGLYRADGSFQSRTQRIYTSGVAFRDQLMQALMHCGYTALPCLMYSADTVRAYRWHDQKVDSTVYTIAEYAALSAAEQVNYRPIRANADSWEVRWAEPVKSGKGPCWPNVRRQRGVKEVPYSEAEHGRIWCVTVNHPDHLIVAQRALRDPNTRVVNKQSRPIVVGQCRQCRNINYDNLTGFLCNECGHCKYGTFSWSVLAAPGLSVDRVKGEEECKGKMADLEEIGIQLEEMRRESEKGVKEAERLIRRCERGLASRQLSDDVSAVTSDVLSGMQASPLSSSLFSFGQPTSSMSFSLSGLSSLPSSSSHAAGSPPFTSPLELYLLTRQKKAYSDLSKTFRVFLNTKREIARYLTPDSLHVDPTAQPPPPSPPTTLCFLCSRAAVGLMVQMLTELPSALVTEWGQSPSGAGMQPLLALQRVMLEGQHWADEATRQSAAYLLASMCGQREMEAYGLRYLAEHVQPLLLHHLQLRSASSLGVFSHCVRFLQLLFLQRLHAAEASELLPATLSICLRVLQEAVEHSDEVEVATAVIAPLLHIALQAAQLPPALLTSAASVPSSSTSSSSRALKLSQPSASPPFPSEMRSPFFAALSREGLANIVMSTSPAYSSTVAPTTSPTTSQPLTGRSRTNSSGSAHRKQQLRSPGGKAIAWSTSTASKAAQRSPLSSPRPPALIHPSAGASEMLASLGASSSQASAASGNAADGLTAAMASSPSPPPLQLPSPTLQTEKGCTAGQLSAMLARMAAMASSVLACTLPPMSRSQPSAFHGYDAWKAAVVGEEPSDRELRIAHRVVDRWRRLRRRRPQYQTLRRLLFNPVSSEVRDITARLLFLLTSGPSDEPSVATPSAASQAMDVDVGSGKMERESPSAPSPSSTPPSPSLWTRRSTAFLDAFISILSTLTPAESLHSSHFFAVFAELLNSSTSAQANAAHKRYAVIRGVLLVVMRSLSAELSALQGREAVCGSSVLSHGTLHAPEVGEDPSFCLYGLSSLLVDLLSVPEVKRAFLRHREHSSAILSFYLGMRGIVFARTRLTELTGTQLHSLVSLLFNAGDKRSAIRAYLLALNDSNAVPSSSLSTPSHLSSPYTHARSLIYIMQQLLDLIHPPLPSKQYQVLLRKSPTQEEYIRGNMRRSPYSSSDFPGPLMRHIQDVICSDLKLTNEENMFELLVGGKIISMELEIARVYEKVWKPQLEAQQLQQSAAQSSSSVADVRERERDRERERERARERERENLRARERLLASISDSSLSHLHPDLMSDSDVSEDDPLLDPASPQPPVTATLIPMTVIFRLTGLDGEATEPLVDSLTDDAAEKVDVEDEFKELDTLREPIGGQEGGSSGLAVLIGRLEGIKDLTHDVDYKLVQELLKVLSFACHLRGNRRHVLQMTGRGGEKGRVQGEDGAGHYAIRVLVQQLILSLSAVQSTSTPTPSPSAAVDDSSAKTAMDLSLSIVALIQALITEEQENSQPTSPASTSTSSASSPLPSPSEASAASSPAQEQFQALLVSLSSSAVRAHPPLTSSLISILPSITCGNPSLLHLLYSLFLPHLSALPRSELPSDADTRWWVTAFADMSEHFPKASQVGHALRHFFFERGLVHRLFDYIQQHRPAMLGSPSPSPNLSLKEERGEGRGDGASAQLAEFIELPSLPYVLRLLHGLVWGYAEAQNFCTPLIPLLQQLESVASAKKIGSLSEQLLTALSVHNPHTLSLLSSLRSSTRQEKKQRAAERRQKLLEKMGFTGGEAADGRLHLVSNVKMRGMEDVAEEEDGALRCCICGEGHSLKPHQMLGIYVYVKPIHISLSSESALMSGLLGDCDDDEVGVSSVTHFTVIHFSCHAQAAKADKKLKPPKSEWDGAKIRNAHTLCNALFPILPPPSSQEPDSEFPYESYVQAVDVYWQRFTFAPRLALPRYLLVLEDLKYLLLRYANEESFSEDSKGGGKESNVGLVVYLLQMGLACLNRTQLGDQGLDQVERLQRRAWRMLKDGRKKPTARDADADHKDDKDEAKATEQKSPDPPPDPDADDDDAPSLTRSGKRRKRRKATPPSRPRARKKTKKSASSASLTAEEQRLLDAYRAPSGAEDDDGDGVWEAATIDFWLSSMVATLLLNSHQEWSEARWPAIKRLLALVAHDTPQLAQRKGEGEAAADAGEGGDRDFLFVNRLVASRPILLFFLLIHRIHALLHAPPFPHTPLPPPAPVSHWRSPMASPASSLPLLLATRFAFLQRFDYALIKTMQGSMISDLMRHGSSRHDMDGFEAAQAELEELCRLCDVWECVKDEFGDVERMMNDLFTLEDSEGDKMQD